MNLLKQLSETGNIPTYDIEKEIETLVKLDKNKPSTRIIRTKKGKKAIAALKDLNLNHNHSWYKELKNRASKDENALALFYRGNKISFQEMFERADLLAARLYLSGVSKGDEIAACITNTPELVYLMLAANRIGAKINCFGATFDKNYVGEILKDCSKKVIFGCDDSFHLIADVVAKQNFENTVIISLADSLPKEPEKTDEYEPELDKYYHYENRVEELKQLNPGIVSYGEYLETVKQDSRYNVDMDIPDNNSLDTEFLVTYTSGSTKIGYPKAIVHSNRSLITMGRFHDAELSGNPEIKGLRGMAHIHPESNTNLITCISDNLMQLWSVALEPEYSLETSLDTIILNKPNYLDITTSFLLEAAKQYFMDKRFHNRKLPFLLAAFTVGEGTSKGEEKFINKFLRETKAGSGVKIMGVSLPFTTLSIGGGDCEHGGIYYTLWKSLYEKLYSLQLRKKAYGMMPVPYAHVTVLRKNEHGVYEECDYNEYGIVVANSVSTMMRYKNNSLATQQMIVEDNLGRQWVTCNVYGYIDSLGGVHVKGRIDNEITLKNGNVIPLFMIDDAVCEDTKNILSCTSTAYSEEESQKIILNVQMQPDARYVDENKIIKSILDRCCAKIDLQLADYLNFRIIPTRKSFPLTDSGKRSVRKLEELGLEEVIALQSYEPAEKEQTRIKKSLKY